MKPSKAICVDRFSVALRYMLAVSITVNSVLPVVPGVGLPQSVAFASGGDDSTNSCDVPCPDCGCESCDPGGPGGPGAGGGGGGAPAPGDGGGDEGSGCDDGGGGGSGEPGGGQDCPDTEADPIFTLNGSAIENVTDISLPGPTGAWRFRRYYDSSLGNNDFDAEVPTTLGHRWLSMSYLRANLTLVQTASNTVNFSGMSAPAHYDGTIVKEGSGVDERYLITNRRTGRIQKYYGFDAAISSNSRGKLAETTDRSYQAANKVGTTYQYDSSGKLKTVVPAYPQDTEYSVSFDYWTSGTAVGRLKAIAVKKGTVPLKRAEYAYKETAPSASSDLGTNGDLVGVFVQTVGSDITLGQYAIKRHTHYRYYKDADADGNDHQLKSVFEADALQRIVDYDPSDSVTAVDDIYSLADSASIGGVSSGSPAKQLLEFASRSFTYYTEDLDTSNNGAAKCLTVWAKVAGEDLTKYHNFLSEGAGDLDERTHPFTNAPNIMHGMVRSESVNSTCSTCGSESAGGVKRNYYYQWVGDWGEYEFDQNSDHGIMMTVVDLVGADGEPVNRRIKTTNYNGIKIREALLTDPLSPSADNIWCYSARIGAGWRTSQRRMPSAHRWRSGKGVQSNDDLVKFLDPTNLTANDSDTVNSDFGVVHFYDYKSTAQGAYIEDHRIGEGISAANKYYWRAYDWGDGMDNKPERLPVAIHRYPEKTTDRSATSRETTELTYDFWDASDLQMLKRAIQYPTVGTGENGSGEPIEIEEYFDRLGRLRWMKDADGYVTYYSYHPLTGGLAYKAVDVDPSTAPTDATGNDTKWVSWNDDGSGTAYSASGKPTRGSGLPAGLALVTKYEYDDLGRLEKTIEPGGATHIVRRFSNGEARFNHVVGTSASTPVEVTITNDGGQMLKRLAIDPAAFSTTATSIPTNSGDYVSLTEYSYASLTGQLQHIDRYHDIAGSGSYRQTRYYDPIGRLGAVSREVDSTSYQVDAVVYDRLGRWEEYRRGVVTTAPADYTSILASSSYVELRSWQYDDNKVGDHHLTKQTTHHTDTKYTEDHFHRNWRGQLRAIERLANGTTAIKPHRVQDVDWMGRATASALVKTAISDFETTVVVDDDYAETGPSAGDRINLTLTSYDPLGQVYRTDIRPASSTNVLRRNRYYDRRGFLVAEGDPYGTTTEYAFDGAGRRYQERIVKEVATDPYDTNGHFEYSAPQPHHDFDQMSGGDDGVIELRHDELDESGEVLERHTVELYWNDSNGLSLTTGAPGNGVRSTQHYYYDDADRVTTIADYGSGASTWKSSSLPSRLTTAPTASSSSYLVTRYEYDDAGRRDAVIDPKPLSGGGDRVTRTFYDDLSRPRFVVENHQSSYDPYSGPPTGAADVNRATGVELNGLNRITKLKAFNSGTTDTTQTTNYWYADPVNASLVTEAAYPDSTSTPSSGSDLVALEYNRDGSRKTRTDQRGVRITYSYDDSRRVTLNAADAPGTSLSTLGVDDAVQAIGRAYDDFGRLTEVTSHAGTTAASTVVNQIAYSYDSGYGRLRKTQQSHSGAASGSTPFIYYYHDTSAPSGVYIDGLRVDRTYLPPNVAAGRYIERYFGSNGSISDRLQREVYVKLHDGNLRTGTHAHTVRNKYNGVGRVVQTSSNSDHGVNAILNYEGTTGDFTALDRWGRVTRQEWKLAGTTVDEFEYTYDEASNRLTRDVTGHTSLNQDYTYDELHRLESVDEDSGSTTHDQSWDLDQLGNWETFTENGSSQTRTHNAANELTRFGTEQTSHDAAGNLTADGSQASDDQFEYDAWNRLVRVHYENQLEVEVDRGRYAYDGLGRRVERVEGSDTTHFYYNEKWQVLQENDGSGSPTAAYSYHPHYVDAVAVRMTPNDEHFFAHDALFNVTSAIEDTTTDAVVERYAYSPYGVARVMNASYTGISGSAIDNELLFTGRRVDPGTGLQLNRYRYYHQGLGRWVSRDPIGYNAGDSNLYGYVGGEPTHWTDPLGLWTCGLEIDINIHLGPIHISQEFGFHVGIGYGGISYGFVDTGSQTMLGVGAGGGVSGGIQVTSADTVQDLAGPSSSATIWGPPGSAQVIRGEDGSYYGIGAGLGPGWGGGIAIVPGDGGPGGEERSRIMPGDGIIPWPYTPPTQEPPAPGTQGECEGGTDEIVIPPE